MAKANKIEMFEKVLSEVTTNESKAFIQHEIEMAQKRSEKRKDYKSKNDKLNDGLLQVILNAMEPNKSYTIHELNTTVEELKPYSGNKVSALVTKLKNDGLVIRTEVKGRATFTKA